MIGMNGVVVIPEKVTMKAIQLVLISGKKCKLGGARGENYQVYFFYLLSLENGFLDKNDITKEEIAS